MTNTKQTLPKGWRLLRLGDQFDIYKGRKLNNINYAPQKGDTRYIQIGDLRNDSNLKYTSDIKGVKANREDLVIAWDGANAGEIGYGLDGFIGSTLAILRPKTDSILTEYIARFLQTKFDYIHSNCSGATIPHVQKEILNNIVIPLPPTLEDQKRITARLKEQMHHIEQARQAAEECLQAAWDLPTAYLRDVFTGEKSKTWAMEKLGNLTTFITDGPHITPKYQVDGIPFLTIRNIVNRKIDLSNTSYISSEDHGMFCKRVKAEKGDILYTKDGTLGIPCLVDTDLDFSFFVSVAIIKLMRDKLDPHFVTYALESPQVLSQVQELGMGAGLKHMVIKSIKALEIPVPSLQEQQRIAEEITHRLNDAKQITDVIESQFAEINELPPALLRQAFAGEL
jgi:type I restriction enzyme S subunit